MVEPFIIGTPATQMLSLMAKVRPLSRPLLAPSIREDLPGDATQADIEAAVARLNADPACTGYIVQLPLPKGVDVNVVLERIDPAKDADGLHPTNLGRLVLRVNESIHSPLPCTPL